MEPKESSISHIQVANSGFIIEDLFLQKKFHRLSYDQAETLPVLPRAHISK